MSQPERGIPARQEPLTRALSELDQILESSEGAEDRLLKALELLGRVVPYDRCALLDRPPGCATRVVVVPEQPPKERAQLTAATAGFFSALLDKQARPRGTDLLPQGAHLAVPLVGHDEVIGVLLVRRAEGVYQSMDLMLLSVVSTRLSAYLTMLSERMTLLAPERAAAGIDELLASVARGPL